MISLSMSPLIMTWYNIGLKINIELIGSSGFSPAFFVKSPAHGIFHKLFI